MKNFILTVIFMGISLFQALYAQIRVAVYDLDYYNTEQNVENLSSAFKQIPDLLISNYSSDDRFTVIDKKNFKLVKDEKERQKSEDFIDGYIVEQGKQEGADFIVRSSLLNNGKGIVVKYYKVEDGTVECSLERSFGFINLGGYVKSAVEDIVQESLVSCFGLAFDVVRAEDTKKDKVKSILIFGGHGNNISRGDYFEVFEIKDEEIGNLVVKRQNVIAEGYISSVEDDNFSILKIKSGGELLSEKLSNGIKLFCK